MCYLKTTGRFNHNYVLTRLRLASEPEVYEISKEINCFLKLYCFGLQFFVCVGDHLLQTTN